MPLYIWIRIIEAIYPSLNSSCRISELTAEVSETRRKRDADLRELANTTRELANMSDAEKQRIIVQISSVQTELKRTMDERWVCWVELLRFEIQTQIIFLGYFVQFEYKIRSTYFSFFSNRDVKLRQSTVHRLEEVEQQLKLESKQRVENEKDARLGFEALENKIKLYTDESADTVRQMVSVS